MATVQDARLQRPTGDRRSLAWSLALHGALLIIILLGGVVIPHKPVPSDLGIRATLIDPDAVRKMRRRPPPAEVRPAEPPPPDPAVQAERERQLSEQKAAERKVTEQKAVEKKLAAKKLAEQKAAERQAAEKQALEKRAADKVAAEKAAAQKAEAQRQAAEEKRRRTEQAELDRMLAEEDALLAAADSGALAEYVALIRQKVERNWVRPPGAAAGLECELHVTQIPGGQVTGVRIGNCPADEAVRRSIEAAVLRASPLPMPANQALFERNLRFVFKPEE
jgi:colicin import membrane protein